MSPTRIYLTGFMGSGKSTIGPRVARALGYTFVDLDALIEERAGRPVQRIFAEEGEAAFRTLEADLLRETTGWERVVVAVGGGALTFEENLRCARERGVVVYLRVPVPELVRRLQRGAVERPLLRDDAGRLLSRKGLREKIETLLARREPFYRRAQHVVDLAGLDLEGSVRAVLRALSASG